MQVADNQRLIEARQADINASMRKIDLLKRRENESSVASKAQSEQFNLMIAETEEKVSRTREQIKGSNIGSIITLSSDKAADIDKVGGAKDNEDYDTSISRRQINNKKVKIEGSELF